MGARKSWYRRCHFAILRRVVLKGKTEGLQLARLTAAYAPAYSPVRDPTHPSAHRWAVLKTAGARHSIEGQVWLMAKGEFGERLKREREMREVSIDELVKSTRISKRFVEALENEEWKHLPGGVFGHGFVRTIARYLGLNEETLLSEYDAARAEKVSASPPKPEERIPSPPKWIPVVAVLVLLLLVVGIFYAGRYGWRRLAERRERKRASEASVAPVPPAGASRTDPASRVASPNPSNSVNSSLDLSVSTSAATRVRVLADGILQIDEELPAGETRHFSANQQFEVTAGDSSAVLLELNGQAMPPIGAPGASGTIVLSQKDLKP